MPQRNIREELAEPENSGKTAPEVVFNLRMEGCLGTNKVKKEEEERVFQDEGVHIERPGNGGKQGTTVQLKEHMIPRCKTERGMGWPGGETSARTRGSDKPHHNVCKLS